MHLLLAVAQLVGLVVLIVLSVIGLITVLGIKNHGSEVKKFKDDDFMLWYEEDKPKSKKPAKKPTKKSKAK